MKTLIKAMIFVSALLFLNSVHAQASCPPGMVPYGTGSDVNMCGPDNSEPAQAPPARWADQWGAFAVDEKDGAVGIAVNASDQNQAKQMAMANCEKRGGVHCKFQIAYYNQCAALAAGNPGYNISTDSTIDKASRAALEHCNAGSDKCRVAYTSCSLPQRIQ